MPYEKRVFKDKKEARSFCLDHFRSEQYLLGISKKWFKPKMSRLNKVKLISIERQIVSLFLGNLSIECITRVNCINIKSPKILNFTIEIA